ncbi:ABC transporter permease [Tsukamurella sp. 8F]|uniref:ABC transporter permease n=1 Tax=unclassified Tsukamurella TaxID=2633480 RepID=UPI0023BA3C55|nr:MULTISPECIES: ABC transporter permease [unclassified Tsukamurella]MDF0528967.1 ABC transporter permease [Tsukamurella sp. 8J]MDF0587340.1 ABC transporter permease [Tsukamurella sp. 8F]
MLVFACRRLGFAIPILLGVAVVVFLTIALIPGDPVALLAGAGASDQTKAALTQRLGLDRALPIQFWAWLTHALRGDFGISISQQRPVFGLVADAFGNTLILALYATVLAVALGLLLGGVAARYPRSLPGRVTSALSSVSLSAPQYSVALILIVYLALATGFFPVSGMHGFDGGGFIDLMWHGLLPALTAALVPAGVIARTFRSSLLEVLSMDFVEALRARGLPGPRIAAHAVHNTLPALITMTGLQIGYLLGGVVFVETIFAWPGIGLLLFQSISSRDLPVTQAGVLVCGVAFVLINIVVDMALAMIDSRVRTS